MTPPPESFRRSSEYLIIASNASVSLPGSVRNLLQCAVKIFFNLVFWSSLNLFDFDFGAKLAREHFQDQVAEQHVGRTVAVDLCGQHYQDFIQRGVLDMMIQVLLCEPKIYIAIIEVDGHMMSYVTDM